MKGQYFKIHTFIMLLSAKNLTVEPVFTRRNCKGRRYEDG